MLLSLETMLSLQCFHCFIICLLRHHTISPRFPLFHYLFVTSLLRSMFRSTVSSSVSYVTILYLFNVSVVSLSVCYVTILSLQGFHCFIICFLRHCSVLCFDCLFLCFLRHYSYLFKCFHCFIICLLRYCSVLGFDCLFLCFLRHYLFILFL